jgi:hypothetical protein
MPDHSSPSPIIGVFVHEAANQFPDEQQAKLKRYEDAINRTTASEDARRARHCAVWSIKLAGDKDLSHPRWREIKEAHQLWKDVWFGLEFGQSGVAGKKEPIHDIEIEWTVDAVTVATAVADADGWDHVPWEALLSELIAMEPTAAR